MPWKSPPLLPEGAHDMIRDSMIIQLATSCWELAIRSSWFH